MNIPVGAVRGSKNGAILYLTPSQTYLKLAQPRFLQLAVCQKLGEEACQCPDCYTVLSGQHPKTAIVMVERFGEEMLALYSYPPPIILFQNLHLVQYRLQMQLLIWLEMYASSHMIFMLAESEEDILPTIRSRSMIFRDIPKERMSEDERNSTFYKIRALFEGKAKVEEWPQDELPLIARLMDVILNEELERRLARIPRLFQASDSELMTLARLVKRYRENTAVHNLPLLLRSFSTLMLQNVR